MFEKEHGYCICKCAKCGYKIEFCTRDYPCAKCGSSVFTVDYYWLMLD